MLNFFKKRTITIENQLSEMVNNPNIDFQLDVYRNNDVDFQVIRQRQLKNIDPKFEIITPEGFAIIISFNKNTEEGNSRYKNFKQVNLSKSFIKMKKLDSNIDFYFILSSNDYGEISDYIYRIQKNIYKYTIETKISFEFKKIK